MRARSDSGFAAIESLLIVVILAIVAGTGYFVWHAKQNTDKTFSDTANSQSGIVKAATVTDFASCRAAKGSVLQETYPEKCVTKNGKAFTDAQSQPATSNSVQSVPFAGLPADLKPVVLANAPCASNGQLLYEGGGTDTSAEYYVSGKAAFVAQCQTVALYVDVSGQWKYIIATQYGFECSVLKQYTVPVALVAAGPQSGRCVSNYSTGDFVTYSL